MSDAVEVSGERECDLHATRGDSGVPATVDGKTVYGPWAFMCDECHDRYGVGLGTGRGQRLVRTQ